jgi:hypothetical protein
MPTFDHSQKNVVKCAQAHSQKKRTEISQNECTGSPQHKANPAEGFDHSELHCYDDTAGWSSLVARWAHNPKVGGSNPPPATNHSLSFQSLSSHPSNDLGPIESKIQALPTVSSCPKRAAKTRPSCDIACVYPIVVRASDCPSRFWRVAIGTCS